MSSPNSKKRKLDLPDLSSLKLTDVVVRVQQLGDEEAALATVRELIHLLDIDVSELQNVGKANPSFSDAKWKTVVPQIGLDPNRGINQLATFEVPSAILPPSFHRDVMTESLKWLNVYKARDSQDQEAARVRLMDAWHIPVCALFKGRLVDSTPECRMLATAQTSGGEVEHEVSMAEAILLGITEMKLYLSSEKDQLAQVFLQLAYAILTDLEKFHFLRYDGSTFARMSRITVNSDTQDGFLFGMARVSERLFSLLLHAYIGVLTAVDKRSTSLGQSGDVSLASSAAHVPKRQTRNAVKSAGTKRSTDRWSQALTKALSAQSILSTCQRQPMEEWEKAEKGLKVLYESVRHLDKIGSEDECEDNEIGQYIGEILSRMSKDLKVVEAVRHLV